MIILQTKGLTKTYGNGDTCVAAVKNLDVSIKKGEFVAIVGSSGSGKSTLLHMLGGLDTPTSGTVSINDKEIYLLPKEELTIFRRKNIGFIFQNFNLIESLTVYENVVLSLGLDQATVDEEYLNQVLSVLGIRDKKGRFPNQLSGGQQQRVAIARALMTRPAVVLADEPTGNLDSYNSHEVVSLLKTSAAEFDQTILMVTHNEELALLTDRIIRMHDGEIIRGDGNAN